MRDEIEGRDGRGRSTPPRQAGGGGCGPTVEDSAAVIPHGAKGAYPEGSNIVTRSELLSR